MKAENQVAKQIRQSQRIDEKLKRNGNIILTEHYQTEERLHRWFSQASCSSDPAAILMQHLSAMPRNNDMFVGICHVIAQEHTNGTVVGGGSNINGSELGAASVGNCSAVSEYLEHDFAKYSVDFLERNYMISDLRRQCYLALSICVLQDQTESFINSGLIEILTRVLETVVRDCFKVLEKEQVEEREHHPRERQKRKKPRKNEEEQIKMTRMNVCAELGDVCRLLNLLVNPESSSNSPLLHTLYTRLLS